MNSTACVSTHSASPTMMVPGINWSGTRRNSRNNVVVVANEPMPRVSKKFVTNPIARSSAVGVALPTGGAAARLISIATRTMSTRPLATRAPRRIRTSVMSWRAACACARFIVQPARSRMNDRDDTFELYDLRVEVVATDRPMVCGHRAGDWLELRGENLTLPAGQPFSIYALASLLPILPAKQRMTHPHDWMTTDTEVACPDPNCGARFRITGIGTRTFRHSEVTAVPLPPD